MKRRKQDYKLSRFSKYLWMIKRDGVTVAYLSVGSHKRYYVLQKDPRLPLVENCSTVKKAFEAFIKKAPPFGGALAQIQL
jgi:hypothetical protein